jgi:MoaA/NifB/PqqE/SkfB family radical SAM enzyme/SAM-dependent methyltransferase
MLKTIRDESNLDVTVVGVNPEEALASFGRNKYQLDIHNCMFEECELLPNSFDFIILDNVIEHFDNPRNSINKIHQLLKQEGRLFIATNNASEHHGLLSTNYPIDHTYTFSPNTLQALLESEGFHILLLETKGHTTYEGYHYPYQCCVAQKTVLPKVYDFKAHSDDAEAMIQNVQHYAEIYDADKNAINHTLPPDEYFYRRVLVAECFTEKDIDLSVHLCKMSGLAPIRITLRSLPDGSLKWDSCYPPDCFAAPPSDFADRKHFWEWLLSNSPRIDEGIAVRLRNADLQDDIIGSTYKNFMESKRDYTLVDFRQFTGARWEFIKNPSLEKLEMFDSQEQNYKSISEIGDNSVIWPDKKSYRYYLKENFQKYYARPQIIALDLSPACNKVCDKCQFHSPRSPYAAKIRNDQVMSVDLAKKILDEASTWPVKPIIGPTFSGEPLIYPHRREIFAYAKKLGFNLSMYTNGMTLDEEECRFLLEIDTDAITISMDAISEGTYNLLQAPGKLSQVQENVLTLLRLRGTRKKPNIGVHFVMEERNKEEFQKLLDYWGPKVDFVSRAIHQNQFSACQPSLPLFHPLGERQACWAAWTGLYIRWDGKISFCGFDIAADKAELNVKDQSIEEIWNSAEFWRWRDAQLNNDHTVLYCKACPDWSGIRDRKYVTDDWQVVRTPFTETYRWKHK